MANRNSLTAIRLRELLLYHPTTGMFMWLVQPQSGPRVRAGDVAGRLDTKGYVRIGIGGHQYRAHRLAWLYVHGEWPISELDHINRIRADNRIENLRPATNKQNKENAKTRIDNTSGHRGVFWSARDLKWCAQITNNGKREHLGYFVSRLAAIAARLDAEKSRYTHSAIHLPKPEQPHSP